MESFNNPSYALILGASSGFGAAISRSLARRGVNIIGVHLDRASAAEQINLLREEIESHGVTSHFFNINAADADQRKETIEKIKADVGSLTSHPPISVLVHSLAFGTLKPFVPTGSERGVTPSQLEMTFNVMAHSLVYWTQDLLAEQLLADGSRIFALTSSGSRMVLPFYGPVAAAKAALESYCRQLAYELGSRSISVNAIEAGVTDTPALRKIPGNEAVLAHAKQRNPRKRLTDPDDVAEVIASLALEVSGWINGATIRVDGGESIVDLDWQGE